jgi:hypothetical protein
LNSKVTFGDIFDGSTNTILIGEFLPFEVSLGWASGTRASLRNTSEIIDMATWQMIKTTPPKKKDEVGGFGSAHPSVTNFCFAGGAVQIVEYGNRSETV